MPNSELLSENITNVSKIYSSVEGYAEQLASQKIITLPELAKLYGMAKQLSDDLNTLEKDFSINYVRRFK